MSRSRLCSAGAVLIVSLICHQSAHSETFKVQVGDLQGKAIQIEGDRPDEVVIRAFRVRPPELEMGRADIVKYVTQAATARELTLKVAKDGGTKEGKGVTTKDNKAVFDLDSTEKTLEEKQGGDTIKPKAIVLLFKRKSLPESSTSYTCVVNFLLLDVKATHELHVTVPSLTDSDIGRPKTSRLSISVYDLEGKELPEEVVIRAFRIAARDAKDFTLPGLVSLLDRGDRPELTLSTVTEGTREGKKGVQTKNKRATFEIDPNELPRLIAEEKILKSIVLRFKRVGGDADTALLPLLLLDEKRDQHLNVVVPKQQDFLLTIPTDTIHVPTPGICPPRDAARLLVSLHPEATLTIDGNYTFSQGRQRLFVTPPLNYGTDHFYILKASRTIDGRVLDEVRRVLVRAGEDTHVRLESALSTRPPK